MKRNIVLYCQDSHARVYDVPVQIDTAQESASLASDCEFWSAVKHAAVVERDHVARLHLVLNLIFRVPQHFAEGQVSIIELDSVLWGDMHDGITDTVIEADTNKSLIFVQPVI